MKVIKYLHKRGAAGRPRHGGRPGMAIKCVFRQSKKGNESGKALSHEKGVQEVDRET